MTINLTHVIDHCQDEFEAALNKHLLQTSIFHAFKALGKELAKLEEGLERIRWYSIATQWLQTNPKNARTQKAALETFIFQAEALVDGENPELKKAAYAMAIISITLTVFATGLAVGFGIGILLGLWATPLAFLTAILAIEQAAVIVAATSAALGIGSCILSSVLFFQDSPLEKNFYQCVDSIRSINPMEQAESSEDERSVLSHA